MVGLKLLFVHTQKEMVNEYIQEKALFVDDLSQYNG